VLPILLGTGVLQHEWMRQKNIYCSLFCFYGGVLQTELFSMWTGKHIKISIFEKLIPPWRFLPLIWPCSPCCTNMLESASPYVMPTTLSRDSPPRPAQCTSVFASWKRRGQHKGIASMKRGVCIPRASHAFTVVGVTTARRKVEDVACATGLSTALACVIYCCWFVDGVSRYLLAFVVVLCPGSRWFIKAFVVLGAINV